MGDNSQLLNPLPADIKMLGDKAFAMGVNWIVLHTSAHQPFDAHKPGFSLGMAGSHFHRNNILYEKNNEWMKYLARCQPFSKGGYDPVPPRVKPGGDGARAHGAFDA